jgi:hypothetical protein
VQRPFLLSREIAGIVVLAHPEIDGGDPITITSPGSVVWGLLDVPSSLDELTELIAEGFEADPEVVRVDLESLLTQLEEQRMVIRCDDDGIALDPEDRALIERATAFAAEHGTGTPPGEQATASA